MAAPDIAPAATRRRPRDRKQQIVVAAVHAVAASGYHTVTMADIADSVGITAGALYRHFSNKQDLLRAVVEVAVERLSAPTSATVGFDEYVETTLKRVLDNRELCLIWRREIRNLPTDLQHKVTDAVHALRAVGYEALTDRRPDLDDADRDLLSWAVLSLLASPATHSQLLDGPAFLATIQAAAETLASQQLRASIAAPWTPPRRGVPLLSPASRREALLAAAIRLFGEKGFTAVSMAEIGAAADVAGPSVYAHFDSKAQLLIEALSRANQSLWLGLHRALETSASTGEALASLVGSYVDLVLSSAGLIGTLGGEIVSLPPAQYDLLREVQRDYVAEWIALLRRHRDDLSDAEARVLVHGALGVINDLSRTPHLYSRPALPADLVQLALSVLGIAELREHSGVPR